MLLESTFLYIVYPGIKGSSGNDNRNLSSLDLNKSTDIPVRFLKCMGRLLKSRGPLMPKEALRMFCIRVGAAARTVGTLQILPRDSSVTLR